MTSNNLPPGWHVKTLGDLFDDASLKRLREILQKKDNEALEIFVQEHRDELMSKGVLPSYLIYYLKYAFKTEEK